MSPVHCALRTPCLAGGGVGKRAVLTAALMALTWGSSAGSAFPADPPETTMFQLGSEASASVTTAKPSLMEVVIGHPWADTMHLPQPVAQRSLRELDTGRDSPEGVSLNTMIAALLAIAAVSALCHMMPVAAAETADAGRHLTAPCHHGPRNLITVTVSGHL